MRIGFVLNILDEEYQISIYEGIKAKAIEYGIEVICFQQEYHDFISEIDFKYLYSPEYFNLDGIIMLSSVILDKTEVTDRKELEFYWGKIPVVSLGQIIKDVPSVMVQTDSSMKNLLDHLIVDHKYRNFLFISGSIRHQDAKRREEFFKKTFEEYAEEIPHLQYRLRHGLFTERAAMEVMETFVHENPDFKPDAIVCANDNMAIGVYKYLKIHTENTNLKNCAVTGIDDIPQSQFEIPALTTIRQPLKQMAYEAMETMTAVLRNQEVLNEKYVESKMIKRKSCGCHETFDESYQKKFLEQVQSNYIRSENLLRMVSHIGQELNSVSTKEGLRHIINGDMDLLEIKNFCVLWFPEKFENFNSQLKKGLMVEPVYVRRNGKAFYEFAGNRIMTLGEFYNKFIYYDENQPKSTTFRFLSHGKEIKGCVLYDAEATLLPYLSSIGIDISQTLNRVYDMEEKKKRSEYLESEVTKRTQELIAENKKRMEVEAEVLKISEIERQRFSTDLHDDICQRLAGISMLCRSYSNQDELVSKNQMIELAELISDTLTATRQYAHNSYPVELETLGINASLSNLCNSIEKNAGIKCEYLWNVDEGINFSKLQKVNIFRIIQEALHNAMKHSKASLIKVSVNSKNKKVIINVSDNGCGISEEKQTASGIGLNSMQYRANQIDAIFNIKQNKPKGTCVEVIIEEIK